MVSAQGTKQIDGQTAYLEILVVVPKGQTERAAKSRALKGQGAKAASSRYATTGLVWDNATATQRYNPAGQPVNGQSALVATQSTWNNAGSSFRFVDGGTTSTCPSLVPGCPGRQQFDGQNGVGWAALEDGTLGVTVYHPSIDEADMGINTRYPWNLGCQELATAAGEGTLTRDLLFASLWSWPPQRSTNGPAARRRSTASPAPSIHVCARTTCSRRSSRTCPTTTRTT